MTQLETFLLIGLFIGFFATGVIFFTHKKQAAQVLDETHRTHTELYGEATRIIANLEGQLIASQKAFNDQLITLQKANDKLSTEKTTALQQYQSTATLLDVANKKYQDFVKVQAEQHTTLNKKITEHKATIRELELQLNQVIGHYQAEKQRNLLAEHTHISESLAQLTTLEKQLTATDTVE
jgi:predicted RNase H-like nuclease (RuvC/YqgF family)